MVAWIESKSLDERGGLNQTLAKYLNNIVEQDHLNIKKRQPPMLGFKTFDSARVVLGWS